MKTSRTWLVWMAFAVCAATILGAMAWQTRNAIASEQDRAAAEMKAELQEKMRLALWRMDTLGSALLLEEDGGGDADFIRSRLEWKESGQLTEPDGEPASAEMQRAITLPGHDFESSYATVAKGNAPWKVVAPPPSIAPHEAGGAPLKSEEAQQIANNLELEKRSQAVDNVASRQRASMDEASAKTPRKRKAESKEGKQAELAEVTEAEPPPAPSAAAPADPAPVLPGTADSSKDAAPLPAIRISPTRPVWVGDELFLLRSVSGPPRSINGSWIDLRVLEARLLGEIRDLLPVAQLLPAKTPSADGLVLASFPLRLQPGFLRSSAAAIPAPAVMISLGTGWAAALLALLASSFLIRGIMRLSERRASFVSAVTHELRTPLTTFRLYSDMLESGAVKPEKQGNYLRVLSREADRLSHLVENVLAFSRIERGSARSSMASGKLVDLLSPMRERFEARLATASMTLHMPLDESPAAENVRVDGAAIEHILFNLVDNAAKYAAGGAPPELRIFVEKRSGKTEIHVRDHGPGIPVNERRRIFRAFHKSAREAAESRPGVGLGLALSRRLAQGMGGDLICSQGTGNGALFILSLPV